MTATRTATDTLVISEVFGPTVQGEGPHAGQRAAFIRLGGCNLTCTWCDTAYTWDAKRFDLRAELHRISVDEAEARILGTGARRVIVTGGEPILQQRKGYGLITLVRRLRKRGIRIDIETNGTLTPLPRLIEAVDLFVVSPKLGNAGMDFRRTLRTPSLSRFSRLAWEHHAVFKFVCTHPDDLNQIARITTQHSIPRWAVWVMPEGTTTPALLTHGRALIGPTLAAGYNFTTRLHILMWGSERGR